MWRWKYLKTAFVQWRLTNSWNAFHFQTSPLTANNFGIMYSRRISQNSFLNLIYIFPKSSMIFCQELQDPKRNYKNQIWTWLPRMSLWKKLHTLDLNSGPLHMRQVFCRWTIKADAKGSHILILVPFRTTKDSFLPVTLLVWQICSLNWDLHINNFVRTQCFWLWWSNVKILTTVAEDLGLNPGCEF